MDLKRYRWTLVLSAGIVLGLLSIGRKPLRAWRSWSAGDPADLVTVLLAAEYIPAFSLLQPAQVYFQECPKWLVPPGALKSLDEIENAQGQRLLRTVIAIPKGHVVTRALLVDAARQDRLGSMIGPGFVGVAFEIDRAHGVGGWIKPGDSIALFGSTATGAARLLFQSLLVLAVDEERIGEADKPKEETADQATARALIASSGDRQVITVLARPREAAQIIETREHGAISVALRSPGEDMPWPGEK